MPSIQVDDPTEFLASYGVDLEDVGGSETEKVALCPFHDDQRPSCQVNIDKQVFRCPVCMAKGDIIDLVAASMKVKRATIISHIEQRTQESPTEAINGGLISAWHNMLMASVEDLTLLKNRKGITPVTCKKFMIGKDGDRYTIPVADSSGQFVNARKWSPTDKIRKVINLKGRGKRQLFPISSLSKDSVIVTEGEFKALLLLQMGFNGISPTGGASTWAPSWNSLFKDKIVYVMYDVDSAGKRGAQKVARSLFGTAKEIRVIDLPIDANEFPRGDITDFVVQLNMGAQEIQELLDKAPVWRPDPLVSSEVDDPTIYDVSLAQSGNAKHYHKFVRVKAVVSAKDSAPFIVPKVATVNCPKDRDFCALCPVFNQPTEKVEITIDGKSSNLLNLVNIPEDRIAGALKTVSGIPRRCDVCRFEIKETQNIEEVRLVPEIRIRHEDDAEQHVVRRAFFSGHGLEANEAYEFEARVVPEPKSQYATLVIYKADASQDSLSTYSIGDHTRLLRFRPTEWTAAGLKAKLDDLYEDLEANV